MSISYSKSVPVVFLVQEGDELPRAATAEDFLKAGFVPAASRFEEAPIVAVKDEPVADTAPASAKDEGKDDDCPLTCDDCLFLGEDHILVELVTIPELIGDTLGDVFKDAAKVLRLDDLKGHVDGLLDPFWFVESEDKVNTDKPASKEKTSSVEDIAGDIFNGAFSVFNAVKGGLSGLLDPVTFPEPSKPAANESTPTEPVAPESVKEEVHAEADKPEFSTFEQTVIKQFEEIGFGEDAKSALRKSKEFSEFLSSKQPTPEQAKAFAEMLKNGKPPFFG